MKDFIMDVIHKADEQCCNIGYHPTDATESGYILVFDCWEDLRKFTEIIKKNYGDNPEVIEINEIERDPEYDTRYVEWISDNEWTFSDEGFVCSECQKWHFYDDRGYTSYANYKVFDGWIKCGDCLKKHPEDYIQDMIDNPKNANTILEYKDLLDLRFEKINIDHYANGWYGQEDSPQKILEKAKKEHPNMEFIFDVIKDGNPWECSFDLYGREIA